MSTNHSRKRKVVNDQFLNMSFSFEDTDPLTNQLMQRSGMRNLLIRRYSERDMRVWEEGQRWEVDKKKRYLNWKDNYESSYDFPRTKEHEEFYEYYKCDTKFRYSMLNPKDRRYADTNHDHQQYDMQLLSGMEHPWEWGPSPHRRWPSGSMGSDGKFY